MQYTSVQQKCKLQPMSRPEEPLFLIKQVLHRGGKVWENYQLKYSGQRDGN